jgi:hypothetical protein
MEAKLRHKLNDLPTRSALQRIDRDFSTDPNQFLDKSEDLRKADFEMIGKLIQVYCHGDYSSRRIIDALRDAKLDDSKRNASKLQDAQVWEKLAEAAQYLPTSNLRDGIEKAQRTFQLHKQHRHNFAHWAARKVPKQEALIFFSKNYKEAKRRDGNEIDSYQSKYGIISLPDFILELEKLQGHAQFLAQSATYIENNLEEIRASLSD